MTSCFVWTYARLLAILGLSWRTGATSEKRLITTLLDNYNRNGIEGRPVIDTSRSLSVALSFSLIQIIEFDQQQQMMTIVGWIHLQWRDALLRWNSSEYDNIQQVVLHPRQIWTPDVVLVNAIRPPQLIHDSKLIVVNSGLVIWVSHVHYELSCPTASSRRPDEPDCELRFGSWTLNSDQLRLQSLTNHVDTSHYVRHWEWELVKSRVKMFELQYPWCPGVKFSYVAYRFALRRHWRPNRQREVPSMSAATRGATICVWTVTASVGLLRNR